jgi:branched-chain amino acid transport system ATP-binding protein
MLLDIKNLTVKYGEITALDDISLTVKEHELTTLLGANGAGKSTLLKTISGLLKPAAGKIAYAGDQIHRLQPEAIVKKGISHCPEGRMVFPLQTVYENMKIGAYTRKDNEVESDIEKYFTKFPRMGERCNQMAGSLSGGEQQMLAICRALMSRPKLLLLDEPSMGLAPFVVKEVFDIVREISSEGTDVLLVEQNAKMALKVSTYCYVMEVGRIVAEGNSADLMKSETIKKSFLGG